METSEEGRKIIDQCFISIGGVKSFTCFTRLSPQQQECISYLKQHLDSISGARGRDVHLRELIFCIVGNDAEDADEPLAEGAFSQYRFYRTYSHDLVFFPEKFDFLLKCVEEAVCVIRQTSKFMKLVDTLAKKTQVDPLPDSVVNYDRLLQEDEERRVQSFTLRKDWVCKVPHFLEGAGRPEVQSGHNLRPLGVLAEELLRADKPEALMVDVPKPKSVQPKAESVQNQKRPPKASETLRAEMEKLIRDSEID